MSANVIDNAQSVEFLPCIGFFGRAQEALDFCARIFGGGYQVLRRGEAGEPEIMYARFTAPGVSFAVTDGAKQLFDALADGGQVLMPLAGVPWGGQFGMLFDRFDNEWLIASS